MLTTEYLARTIVADRERELRDRLRIASGVPSGPRHPRSAQLPDVRHLVDEARDRRSRPAARQGRAAAAG